MCLASSRIPGTIQERTEAWSRSDCSSGDIKQHQDHKVRVKSAKGWKLEVSRVDFFICIYIYIFFFWFFGDEKKDEKGKFSHTGGPGICALRLHLCYEISTFAPFWLLETKTSWLGLPKKWPFGWGHCSLGASTNHDLGIFDLSGPSSWLDSASSLWMFNNFHGNVHVSVLSPCFQSTTQFNLGVQRDQ